MRGGRLDPLGRLQAPDPAPAAAELGAARQGEGLAGAGGGGGVGGVGGVGEDFRGRRGPKQCFLVFFLSGQPFWGVQRQTKRETSPPWDQCKGPEEANALGRGEPDGANRAKGTNRTFFTLG